MIEFKNKLTYIENKNQNTEFKPHFHQTYSFALITNGECEVMFNSKKITYKKNDFRIINPYEVHYVTKGIWEYKSIVLDTDTVNEITYEIANKKNLIFENKINSKELNVYFIKMYNNQEESIYFFFEKLLIYSRQTIHLPEKKLQSSLEYINSRFTDKIILEDLAALENLSKYHFLRLFKNQTGLTPHQYIIIKRLNYAIELMKKEKNLSIVATLAGFSDQSHFIKEFKKVFGFTPKH